MFSFRRSAAALVVLAAVAGAPMYAGGAKEPAKGEPKVVNFWFAEEGKQLTDYYINFAKAYSEKTGVTVVPKTLPAASSDVETVLNTAKMSNAFPDVFISYLVFMGTQGSKGAFADIEKNVAGWKDKDDIFPTAFEMGKYAGKTYGVPYMPIPEIWVFRKDYFRDAGLDPAKPPRTWEELTAAAKKLTKYDSNGKVVRAGIDLGVFNSVFVFEEPFFRMNGSPVIDEVTQTPQFNDPKGVEALQFLVDFYKMNVSILFNYAKKDEAPFLSGNSAIASLQPQQISKLLDSDPTMKDKIGYIGVLGREKRICFAGYRLLTIGADSKVKDESWQFIETLMSKENMLDRAKNLGFIPIRKSLQEPFITLNPELNRALLEGAEFGKGRVTVPWSGVFAKYVATACEQAYQGTKSPKQALDDAMTALLADIKK